jgi:hypothetical protein
MIVKKLYRKVKNRWWNSERQVFENTTVTDYVGWFLFGFIPVYLIELDKREDVDFEDSGKCTLRYGINKKYKHLMTKDN